MQKIRQDILLILLMVVLSGCKVGSTPDNPPKYNVVLISADNMRADHMSLYGYHRKTTPNIDKWAASAQVFDNFYSTSQMTIPSEGSVFTGRYPFENGLISFEHSLWPQVETIPSILKKQKYHTLALGNSAEYIVFPAVESSFKPLFDEYLISIRNKFERLIPLQRLESFLNKVGSENFLLWLPAGTVHSPYGFPFKYTFSNEDYRGPLKIFETYPGSNFWIYKNILYPITSESKFSFAYFNNEFLTKTAKKKINLKPADLDWMIGRYDDGVIEFDRQFATIMKIFEQRDLLKNTIFVLYSNHGEELNEHGYFGHFDIYQGNVRTPLIIKTPAMAAPNRHSTLASSIDIMPTILKMMKIVTAADIDGLDLFSPEAKARKNIYLVRTPLWESLLRINNKATIWDDFRSKIATEDHMEPVIVTEKYKLIHRRARFILKKYSAIQVATKQKIDFPEYEMYDLQQDPLEQKNLAFHSKDFAELQKTLKSFEDKIIRKKNSFKKLNSAIQDYQ